MQKEFTRDEMQLFGPWAFTTTRRHDILRSLYHAHEWMVVEALSLGLRFDTPPEIAIGPIHFRAVRITQEVIDYRRGETPRPGDIYDPPKELYGFRIVLDDGAVAPSLCWPSAKDRQFEAVFVDVMTEASGAIR